MDKLKKKISVVVPGVGRHDHESLTTTIVNGTLSDSISLPVHYLGHVSLKLPGLNEICENVEKMYSEAKSTLKTAEKGILTITREGVEIKQNLKSDGPSCCLYKNRRILYCGVDKKHQKIFSFNYQYGSRAENIHLHVVVCKNKEDAKTIAKRLSEIFRELSAEQHKKEKEDKKRHSEGLNGLSFKSRSISGDTDDNGNSLKDSGTSTDRGSCTL